jgi:hypothetical protein
MSSYCRLVVLRFLAAGFFAMYLLTVFALIGGDLARARFLAS